MLSEGEGLPHKASEDTSNYPVWESQVQVVASLLEAKVDFFVNSSIDTEQTESRQRVLGSMVSYPFISRAEY